MRNSTFRHQRLLARSIHFSGKNSEGEAARSADERPRTGYQGFSNKPPPAVRNATGRWNKDNATATGSTGIDNAILSSFASPRNSGASWPRSASVSGPPRINRTNNYRQPDEMGGRPRDNKASGNIPREGYTPSSQSRLGGGHGANYPEPGRASRRPLGGNASSTYPSKDGYTSSSPPRTGFGYRGNRPEQAGVGRFTKGESTASLYVPGTGYATPLPTPNPSAQEGYEPDRRQSRERAWQGSSSQDRRPYGYGGQGSYGTQGSTQDRRGSAFQRSPRDNGYAPRDAFGPRSQQSTTPDGYQSQESPSTPLAEGEEPIIRPPEPISNEYEKRRAGKFRDKARASRGFDESESAILEEGVSQQDKKAARRAMRAKKRENREDTPKMIPLYLPEYISVPNLAKALKIRVDDFMRQMEQMGFTEMGHDHILNAEVAGLIAMEYNYEPIADKSAERDLFPRYVSPTLFPPPPKKSRF